jgi:hypothetical protein
VESSDTELRETFLSHAVGRLPYRSAKILTLPLPKSAGPRYCVLLIAGCAKSGSDLQGGEIRCCRLASTARPGIWYLKLSDMDPLAQYLYSAKRHEFSSRHVHQQKGNFIKSPGFPSRAIHFAVDTSRMPEPWSRLLQTSDKDSPKVDLTDRTSFLRVQRVGTVKAAVM